MSSGKVILGIIAGAAAGAALGMLLAPEKGSKTRTQLSKKGDDLVGNITAVLGNFLTAIVSTLGDVKSESKDLLDKGKEKVKETINVNANPG